MAEPGSEPQIWGFHSLCCKQRLHVMGMEEQKQSQQLAQYLPTESLQRIHPGEITKISCKWRAGLIASKVA